VTTGDAKANAGGTPEESRAGLAGQIAKLAVACEQEGREPSGIRKVLLTGFTPDAPLASVDAFVDFAGRHAELGFDEIVLHWPIPDSPFAADFSVFEQVAAQF
jgi:hypothetical protein